MSTGQRTLVGTLILAAAGLVMSSSPLSACYEATGWCCVEMDDGHSYCCWFEDDRLEDPVENCIQR